MVILRYRLRRDGYSVQTDAVNDALQAVRLVRARAKDWNIDPNKIGIMGFSAGAELAAPTALFFEDFDKKNSDPTGPLAGISSRPDFVAWSIPALRPLPAMAAYRFRATLRLRSSPAPAAATGRSEEHTSELQSHLNIVCRLLLEKKKKNAA